MKFRIMNQSATLIYKAYGPTNVMKCDGQTHLGTGQIDVKSEIVT